MKALLPLTFILTALFLTACGGSASAPSPAPPAPRVTVTPPDLSAITAEVERHPVADMAIIIGDADGRLLTYEKGAFQADQPVRLASASKLLTGLAVWSLVEAGEVSESSRASELIAAWDGRDARADVTLAQLMSFTSGLDTRTTTRTCAGLQSFTLERCVARIHDEGLTSAPGSTYTYGPNHMQVAALMAKSATGEDLHQTLRETILDPVGASAETGFRAYDNVRYSAGASGTASDYARILQALLAGELFSDTASFIRTRSNNADIAFQPATLTEAVLDWRYGFGFWVECDTVPFTADCETSPTLSSPGALGTIPWIDFETGYWAVIAMEESGGVAEATRLQQTLQPMIEDALR